MYFDQMVHERVSLKQKCALIGGAVKGRDFCNVSVVVNTGSWVRLQPISGTPAITHHSCLDDWLTQFSLANVNKGGLKHHHWHTSYLLQSLVIFYKSFMKIRTLSFFCWTLIVNVFLAYIILIESSIKQCMSSLGVFNCCIKLVMASQLMLMSSFWYKCWAM